MVNAVRSNDQRRSGDQAAAGRLLDRWRLHRSNPQLSDASAEAGSIPVRLTKSSRFPSNHDCARGADGSVRPERPTDPVLIPLSRNSLRSRRPVSNIGSDSSERREKNRWCHRSSRQLGQILQAYITWQELSRSRPDTMSLDVKGFVCCAQRPCGMPIRSPAPPALESVCFVCLTHHGSPSRHPLRSVRSPRCSWRRWHGRGLSSARYEPKS
jgi:hypothetical protein